MEQSPVEGAYVVGVEAEQALAVAQYGHAEWIRGPQPGAAEVLQIQVPVLLVPLLQQLLEHQPALQVQVGERRPQGGLGEQVQRVAHVAGAHQQAEEGHVAARAALQRAADGLHGPVEVAVAGVGLGAPEQHVFDQVAQSAGGFVLEPGTGAQDEGGLGRVQAVPLQDQQVQTAGQGVQVGSVHVHS